MKLVLTMDLDHAAFLGGDQDAHSDARDGSEIARILRHVADLADNRIVYGSEEEKLKDINGNTVGRVFIEED